VRLFASDVDRYFEEAAKTMPKLNEDADELPAE